MSNLSLCGRSLRAALSASLAALILASCGGGSGTTSQNAAASESAASDSVAASSQLPAQSQSSSASPAATPPASSAPPASATPSTPTAPVTPSAPSAPAATTQVIEYYGDSTIWGYRSGSGGQVAVPAPAAFAAALPASGKYNVRNEGVNGSTSCQLLNGTDGRHPSWDAQMAASQASVVIINHAINDEWQMDVATYKSCLTSLAQKAKSRGKKVVFETPNPTRDSGPSSLDVYVNAMKAVATQEHLPVIDQYKYLTDYLNGQSPYTICPDGLHPTDAVYIMKGKYAASVFVNLGM
jgi:lysophospholipase L1-like esterase